MPSTRITMPLIVQLLVHGPSSRSQVGRGKKRKREREKRVRRSFRRARKLLRVSKNSDEEHVRVSKGREEREGAREKKRHVVLV